MELGRYFGFALATFLFIAALFVAWRCFAVGIARPLPVIVLVFAAALLAGMGWLVRQFAAGQRLGMALVRIPSAIGRTAAEPTIESSEPSDPADDVVQQLTLRTTAEGAKELSGWLRLNVVAGQRNGSLHVAFCPPFDRPPVVEAEAVAGPDCRIKVAEAQTYGVRLDIKLNASAAVKESVLVSFFAASGPA